MYIDPGTGSIILQALLAGFLGAGVIVKVFWKKIRSFFGKKEVEDQSDQESIE